MGARGGPTIWGRVAALLGRITQSLHAPGEVRTQIYVDDPCIAIWGNAAIRDQVAATIMLVWLALGVRLAFPKGMLAAEAEWIGIRFAVAPPILTASIKEALIAEIRSEARSFMDVNVIPRKRFLSFIGKCNHVATLLYGWRPFLRELWAVVSETPDATGAPQGCVWTKQCAHTLLWVLAFCDGRQGALSIRYDVRAYLAPHRAVQIASDACVWGSGAVLILDGRPAEWFGVAISEMDAETLGHAVGDPKGQQTWECLAVLVALRVWRAEWWSHRMLLTVRADSIVALSVVANMKAAGRAPNLIAREMALDFGDACYRPRVTDHTPGVCNVLADVISRRFHPGVDFRVPVALRDAKEVSPPTRDKAWWRARLPPQALSITAAAPQLETKNGL